MGWTDRDVASVAVMDKESANRVMSAFKTCAQAIAADHAAMRNFGERYNADRARADAIAMRAGEVPAELRAPIAAARAGLLEDGRPVETYAAWLAPWRLVTTRHRVIEPDYPRPDVGTYMLFAGPAAR